MPTMTALMKTARGPGHVELREVDVPTPGPDEVIVEVHHVGICGSDLHIARDTHPNHPPVILGHEFSGTVATLGSAVTGWREGDRVVSELHGGACGQCRLCKTGQVFACPHKRPIGWWTNGAYADYIRVPARLLHRVPDALPLVEAALTEPLAVCHPQRPQQPDAARGGVRPAQLRGGQLGAARRGRYPDVHPGDGDRPLLPALPRQRAHGRRREGLTPTAKDPR